MAAVKIWSEREMRNEREANFILGSGGAMSGPNQIKIPRRRQRVGFSVVAVMFFAVWCFVNIAQVLVEVL
jgi:hypothetical protein